MSRPFGRSRRHALALVCAAVSAVALAACSSSSPSASSSGAGRANQAGHSAVDAVALVREAGHSSTRLESAHITTTSELGGKTTSFSGVIGYHPTRLDFRIGVAGTQLRDVLVDGVFYIKVPQGGGTKPWIAVGIKQISQLSGIDLDSLLNNASSDQTVQLLSKSADLSFVGNETVGGVPTTHLRGTVDVAKVFAALDTQEQSSQKALQGMVEQLGMKSTKIDLWVNGDQIPVKVVETYTSKLGAGSTTMLLTELNAPVDIKAPSPSLVQKFPG